MKRRGVKNAIPKVEINLINTSVASLSKPVKTKPSYNENFKYLVNTHQIRLFRTGNI